MLPKLGIALLAVLVVAAALYQFAGLRLEVDGSGLRPRFLSRGPDFDALEADRARTRATPPASPQSEEALSRPVAVSGPAGPAAAEGASPRPAPHPAVDPGGALKASEREEWAEFRGPHRDGRYEGRIRTVWPRAGLPLLWKQPVGLGYASFVAADGRAFTIEQRRDQEFVAAYDLATGRELWTHGWSGAFTESMGGDGPRATPTYHQGRIYALGALGELRCLDASSGALIWRRDIVSENGASNLQWGMSAAPLIADDMVIVLPGGPNGHSVAAYARTTGTPIWTALDDRQAYTSPMLATLGGVRQLVIVTATRALGITVDEGRLLWEYPWAAAGGINVAQPLLLGDDRIFLSASYGQGAAVFEVSGADGVFATRTVWQNSRMKNRFTSSLLHRGYIYGLDESILACIDAATGELRWKGGRYGYGQTLLAGDNIVVLSESGDVALVKASPERHEEIARFPAIDGKTWNHPIIVDGRLLVRNLREMAAFDIRP